MNTISETPQRNLGFYVKRTVGAILLVALAATFIYSAYSKSGIRFNGFKVVANDNAFDSFQWSFLDLGVSSILVAGVIARLMIGLELLLGLFLLFHIYLKKITYKAVIAILVVFIIYLIMVIAKQGNTGNCGCFGDNIAMKPLAAIWKNLAMIAATVVLMFIYPVKPYKNQEYVALVLGLVSFCTPFLVNNIYTGTAPEPYNHPINLNLLYEYEPKPSVELRKGKYILAFMSYSCPHCKKAAYLLQIIHREHPEIPMFLVLDGAPPFEASFFSETHAKDIPHLYYHHMAEFDGLVRSGLEPKEEPGVPTVFWINNGKIEYKSKYAYYQLDPSYMLEWLKKP
jgi:hypothetical protein